MPCLEFRGGLVRSGGFVRNLGVSSGIRAKRRGLVRFLGKLALAGLVALLVLEGLVRGILFHGWLAEVEACAPLRKPSSYATEWQDEYWLLRHLLDRAPQIDPERIDRLLGWLPVGVQPGVYDHADRDQLEGRRPVLLFGDSYAAGMAPPRTLFQSLLDHSPLAAEHRLINYGCPGYGFDQAVLLMEQALDDWVELDPIVLVGILLDDDFDRSLLEIRSLPKPRFDLSKDPLELERPEVQSVAEYTSQAARRPILWSWRLLVHGGLLPRGVSARLRGDAAHRRDCIEVAQRLIQRAVDGLEARELAFGFVLFHAPATVTAPERLEWRETVAVAALERRGVPFALSRDHLTAHMAESGEPVERYFYSRGMQLNHLNRLGQRAVFEGIRRLVEGLSEAHPRRTNGQPDDLND